MQRTDRTGAAWRRTGGVLLAWTLALAGTTPMASAGGASPGIARLTLEQALANALARNKELAAFAHRLAAQRGRREQAGRLPNPDLQLEIEDFLGSGRFQDFDRAQTTLSLGWVLEGRLRAGRVERADAGAARVAAEQRILLVEVAADTAEHFLASLANQARLERAEEAIALAERTVGAVARRVRSGKVPTAELVRAEAELAMDRLGRDDVTHELAAAYHRLAAQWGDTRPGFSRVEGDLLSLPDVEPHTVLADRFEGNPQLGRLATEERLAKADLHLAEARRWPALRPRLGVRRNQTTDDTVLVAQVSLPIPALDRRRGAIAASRARVSGARAEAEAARVRLETLLFELYEELQHHFHRAETLRTEVIPRLSEALEGTRRAYERGRYGYLELRSAQRDLLRARNDLIEASTGAHRLVIALERLTGEPVVKR